MSIQLLFACCGEENHRIFLVFGLWKFVSSTFANTCKVYVTTHYRINLLLRPDLIKVVFLKV